MMTRFDGITWLAVPCALLASFATSSSAIMVAPLDSEYRAQVGRWLTVEGDPEFPPELLEATYDAFYYITSYLANRGGGPEFFSGAESVVFDSDGEISEHLDNLLKNCISCRLDVVDLSGSSVSFGKMRRPGTAEPFPPAPDTPRTLPTLAGFYHPESTTVSFARFWVQGLDENGESARIGFLLSQGESGLPRYHMGIAFSEISLTADSTFPAAFGIDPDSGIPVGAAAQLQSSDFARRHLWYRWSFGVGAAAIILAALLFARRKGGV